MERALTARTPCVILRPVNLVIHPTAIIHPSARLHPSVCVEACAVIGENVVLGAKCHVGPHVFITGQAAIGEGNRFHAGCVIGDAPQDLKYKEEPTTLIIGDNNVFREHATVHRSSRIEEKTLIGSRNFFMAHSHIGHNCRIDDEVILANGALLGGYAVVEDRAFISGHCMVHQHTRVGRLSLMQGGAGISKDLPPFTIATGNNRICGLNIIGLRRAGLSPDERLELKRLYRFLFREGRKLREGADIAGKEFSSAPSRQLVEFVRAARRGVCADIGGGGGTED